jgi:hypothetical protein
MNRKILGIIVCMLLIVTTVLPVTGNLKTKEIIGNVNFIFDELSLPPPISIDMVLEEYICRRMSTREAYTSQQVTDEELSTVLWAAYGYTNTNNRTIFNPNGIYSTIIYVIRSDATYKYVPENHSLSLFKTGNYLYIGQDDAVPIKFGLVWDKSITNDELIGMAEIGMIAQNIYFDAIALDLATITTGGGVDELNDLGLPSNEKPEIIMPLGHPSEPYDFTYNPLPPQNLPSIVNNNYSLEDSINNRLISSNWNNLPLSDIEESQLIWSSYGFSYFWDNVDNKRHRTLPSAVNLYPFKIYAANQTGVYLYDPNTHSITTIVQEDRREEINNSLGPSNIWTATATWIIVPFYNTNIGYQYTITWWYYEVGAISHNVILEATALNLSANIITDISDVNGLRSALGISSQTNLQPWFVIPVGHSFFVNPNNPPEIPDIDGQTNGTAGTPYTYTFNSVDPDGDDVYYYILWGDGNVEIWHGPHASGLDFDIAHTYLNKGTYTIEARVKDVHGAVSDWGTLTITMPKNKQAAYNKVIIPLLEKLITRLTILERLLNFT